MLQPSPLCGTLLPPREKNFLKLNAALEFPCSREQGHDGVHAFEFEKKRYEWHPDNCTCKDCMEKDEDIRGGMSGEISSKRFAELTSTDGA